MARASKITPYNNFILGLITEAIELNQPAKSTTDEDNCLLLSNGKRTRRRGAEFENGYVLSSTSYIQTIFEDFAINTFTWKAVGGIGDKSFSIIQVGSTLFFYEFLSPALSGGEKSFTVDLNAYSLPSFPDVSDSTCDFTSGKGALFVVSKKINPIYIKYDKDTDTISVTEINIKIRDFVGIDDGVPVDSEQTTLTNSHHYNLQNRGWLKLPSGKDPITDYKTDSGFYPAKNIQWFQFKKTTGESQPVRTDDARDYQAGNTSAPQGHFIVDAFNIDRSAVSGIAGLTVDSVNSRPSTVAFFAGRAWYAGVEGEGRNSSIYFTQVLTDLNKAGNCYQDADPASEEDPALVDNDGGVAVIPDIGVVRRLVSLETMLVVIASNGVWAIKGIEGSFKATDYFIDKLGNDGCINAQSVIMTESAPVWWGDNGIFTIATQSEVTQKLAIQNLTEGTIQTFYNDISKEAKLNSRGAYDAVNRKLVWFYKDGVDPDTSKLYFTKALWLDLRLGAFYPWTLASLDGNTPYLASIVESPSLNSFLQQEELITLTSELITTISSEPITAAVNSIIPLTSALKFFTVVPDGAGNVKWTFSDFRNNSFTDWETSPGNGANYKSYAVTWWELNDDAVRYVQAPYIYVYMERTETAFEPNGLGGFRLVNPSGLFVTAQWDFANSAASNRISRQFQAYKLRQNIVPDENNLLIDTGYPVVISRNKIRGKGRSLQLRFDSEDGKDFSLYGWAVVYAGNTLV